MWYTELPHLLSPDHLNRSKIARVSELALDGLWMRAQIPFCNDVTNSNIAARDVRAAWRDNLLMTVVVWVRLSLSGSTCASELKNL